MKILATLSAVPRPSLIGAAPRIMLLAVYGAFAGQNLVLLGAPVTPLAIAVVTFWLTLLTSKAIFWRPEPQPGDKFLFVSMIASCLVALYMIVWMSVAFVQWIWVICAFCFILTQLLFVHFSPDDAQKLPSGRWFAGDHAVAAAYVRLLSWAIYICLAAFFCMHMPVHYWVAFVSLGHLAWQFMTNWVIVLLIYTGDLNLK